MEKKKKPIQNLGNYLKENILLDKRKRKLLELTIVSGVFFVAGSVFSIINYLTHEYMLGYVTLSFSIVSLITILTLLVKPKWSKIAEALFVVASLIMFFYFMYDGGAGSHGFSTYWILVLPFISMMILELKKGIIVATFMFAVICLMLWVPQIRALLRWEPQDEFIKRFPLVYLAALAASLLFEYSRYLTDKANDALNVRLKDAASHDPLTGLTNRYGLNQFLSNFDYKDNIFKEEVSIANAALIDVDNFKSANDLYGHMFGDKVLVEISKVLRKYAGEQAIRFGGDEFVLLFMNKTQEEMFEIGESIRREIEDIYYAEHPEAKYTVSVGLASHEVTLDYRIDRVIELADVQSSKAKSHGKNTVYILENKKKSKK